MLAVCRKETGPRCPSEIDTKLVRSFALVVQGLSVRNLSNLAIFYMFAVSTSTLQSYNEITMARVLILIIFVGSDKASV